MPQNNISILSTRPIDEAWIKNALSKNISIDVIPFIKTNPALASETLKQIEESLKITASVVFTSVNALEAVVSKIKDQNPSWKIFCIGHATKQSVEKYFGENSIEGIADNAKELAEEVIRAKVKEVIFFCGDQRRNELPDLLKKNNIEVKEIVVYQTVALPQKIEKNYDGILFFSPSAVKSFFQSNQLNDTTILFAIGNTTADEINKLTTNKIVVSDEPGQKAVLEKVTAYFQTNPVHH